MFSFNKIQPNQFALLGTMLGILLNLIMDANEQNSFGNLLIAIGQAMVTAAAQTENQKAHPSKNAMMQQIDQMSAQLDELRKQLHNQ